MYAERLGRYSNMYIYISIRSRANVNTYSGTDDTYIGIGIAIYVSKPRI